MYAENLTFSAVNPWFAPDTLRYHRGTLSEFVTLTKNAVVGAVAERPQERLEVVSHLFDWATDTRLLRHCWDHLARHGGEAPGRNGRRYRDLEDDEIWSLLRAVRQAIRAGHYQPAAPRKIAIAKDAKRPERGQRILSLLNVEDRVIQRAIFELLQPLFQRVFRDTVFGFRPRRGRLHGLAHIEQVARRERRYFWVTADVRNAFDSVPLQRLLDVLRRQVLDERLVDLIGKLVSSGPKRGIHQGGPLSPLLLNVYLDHFLDQPWSQKHPELPLVRYADDLLLLCRDCHEAEAAAGELAELLRPTGMQLKDDVEVHDLRAGQSVLWLGFQLKLVAEGLQAQVAENALEALEEHLVLAHRKPNSPLLARAIVGGWIDQLGPACAEIRQAKILHRIEEIAFKLGFDEIPSRAAMYARSKRALERWKALQQLAAAAPQSPPLLASPMPALRQGKAPWEK